MTSTPGDGAETSQAETPRAEIVIEAGGVQFVLPAATPSGMQNHPMELLGDRKVTLTGRAARRQAERDARRAAGGGNTPGGQGI